MLPRLLLVVLLSIFVNGQWEGRGRVFNHAAYYSELIQETIYEVEKRGWGILKVDNITVALNQQMFDWLVTGNITYANGFLQSVQKIDVTNIAQSVARRNIDGEQVPFATVRGSLNFRDFRIGFDVVADLGDQGVHRYTGVYPYTLATLQLELSKNLFTSEIVSAVNMLSLSGGGPRMIFLPTNKYTEVISRQFIASSNWNNILNWGRNVFAPIMVNLAQTRLEFPRVCFNHC